MREIPKEKNDKEKISGEPKRHKQHAVEFQRTESGKHLRW
jgi:hypothetical protein